MPEMALTLPDANDSVPLRNEIENVDLQVNYEPEGVSPIVSPLRIHLNFHCLVDSRVRRTRRPHSKSGTRAPSKSKVSAFWQAPSGCGEQLLRLISHYYTRCSAKGSVIGMVADKAAVGIR